MMGRFGLNAMPSWTDGFAEAPRGPPVAFQRAVALDLKWIDRIAVRGRPAERRDLSEQQAAIFRCNERGHRHRRPAATRSSWRLAQATRQADIEPGDIRCDRPGLCGSGVAAIGDIKLIAHDRQTVRLDAAGVHRADEVEATVTQDPERSDRVPPSFTA